jgi:hypothetical protein
MFCGTLALVLWDMDRWLPVLLPQTTVPTAAKPTEPPIDQALWRLCGAGILAFYGLTCLLYGGIYRPKGADLEHPAFYVLLCLPLFPIVTLFLEERRRARSTPAIEGNNT